jgi:hypothetical protein
VTVARASGRCTVSGSAVGSTEIVVEAHDVVLAEVVAALHLDEDQRLGASRVRDAMSRLPACTVIRFTL